MKSNRNTPPGRSARRTRAKNRSTVRQDGRYVATSPTAITASALGSPLFVYGKKQGRWPQLVGGLAFMVYPYFTGDLTSLVVVGIALGIGVWLLVRGGW